MFKGVGADIKFNDPLKAAVRSTCVHRLEKLTDIADGMTNGGNKRVQQLTRDTGCLLITSLQRTC